MIHYKEIENLIKAKFLKELNAVIQQSIKDAGLDPKAEVAKGNSPVPYEVTNLVHLSTLEIEDISLKGGGTDFGDLTSGKISKSVEMSFKWAD